MAFEQSDTSQDTCFPLADKTTTIMAIAAGLAVANVYTVQPLLNVIGESLAMRPANLGLAVTLTQLGYAAGLILLVPLGDLLNRRSLIVGQTGLSFLALAIVALSDFFCSRLLPSAHWRFRCRRLWRSRERSRCLKGAARQSARSPAAS
jgi:MFS family permease